MQQPLQRIRKHVWAWVCLIIWAYVHIYIWCSAFCECFHMYAWKWRLFSSSHKQPSSTKGAVYTRQSPDQPESPCKLQCIYTFLHLPVTACVRPSVKKLFQLGFVSKYWGCPPLLSITSFSASSSVPLCGRSSVWAWWDHPNTPTITTTPLLPVLWFWVWYQALIIDPSGPRRLIQQWAEQNHH